MILTTDRQIPTILSYIHGDEYYGQQAKQQLIRNSTNTVAYFKDFLGQEYVYISISPSGPRCIPREGRLMLCPAPRIASSR